MVASEADLLARPRTELQLLAKQHGIKANRKSEIIAKEVHARLTLLDTSVPGDERRDKENAFKARPAPKNVLDSAGDLGVPRVQKKKSTQVKEFRLSEGRRRSARISLSTISAPSLIEESPAPVDAPPPPAPEDEQPPPPIESPAVRKGRKGARTPGSVRWADDVCSPSPSRDRLHKVAKAIGDEADAEEAAEEGAAPADREMAEVEASADEPPPEEAEAEMGEAEEAAQAGEAAQAEVATEAGEKPAEEAAPPRAAQEGGVGSESGEQQPSEELAAATSAPPAGPPPAAPLVAPAPAAAPAAAPPVAPPVVPAPAAAPAPAVPMPRLAAAPAKPPPAAKPPPGAKPRPAPVKPAPWAAAPRAAVREPQRSKRALPRVAALPADVLARRVVPRQMPPPPQPLPRRKAAASFGGRTADRFAELYKAPAGPSVGTYGVCAKPGATPIGRRNKAVLPFAVGKEVCERFAGKDTIYATSVAPPPSAYEAAAHDAQGSGAVGSTSMSVPAFDKAGTERFAGQDSIYATSVAPPPSAYEAAAHDAQGSGAVGSTSMSVPAFDKAGTERFADDHSIYRKGLRKSTVGAHQCLDLGNRRPLGRGAELKAALKSISDRIGPRE